VKFENGERVEQLEDQNSRGTVSARYTFKNGQLTGQEQVADAPPPVSSAPFVSVETAIQTATESAVPAAQTQALTAQSTIESIKK